MAILNIIYFTILRNLRDKKDLLLMLVMPIVVIYILGNALSSQFVFAEIKRSPVGFLNEDIGGASARFEDFLSSNEVEEILEVIKVDSYEEGVSLVQNREVVALIYINAEYTQGIQSNAGANIEMITDLHSGGGFYRMIVKNVVDSFVESNNAIMAMTMIGGNGGEYRRTSAIKDNTIDLADKIPGSMDYYGVTMLVMILMYGANYGLHGIAKEYFVGIGDRIKASPIKNYQIYLGRTLGAVFTLFLQAMILVFFTKHVYGVNWGDNLLVIMMICLSLAVFSVGIGIMVCMLAPNRKVANSIMTILVPVFTFLAGGYAPIEYMGELFNKFKYLSPNYIGHRAFFSYIYGGRIVETQLLVILIWGLAFLTMGLAIMLGRRETA
ncbi:ABC transporter permease [Alkaliphilus transvaalensis]|uniref:ABC transporter permease n=1 Tax=Alkaliphilus transvaalensis TaxID=114628 RepID=UPI00047DBA4D|nr:ABC transporter permease [Alkaliphilus transvaalensis]